MSIRARQPAVLTGPCAAAHLGLDGFTDRAWPLLFSGPLTMRPADHLIRTTSALEPFQAGELTVAHPALVLRHLGHRADWLAADGTLTPRDRVELAVEHALRDGLVKLDQLRARQSRAAGDVLLREVLRLRRDEAPAESYAEVRAIQILRSWGLTCWRQVRLYERGHILHRVDLVVPYDQSAKQPMLLAPADGLLVEIDSRQFHEGRFEEDHARQATYNLLGFAWISLTPNQLEHHQAKVRRALEAVYHSARSRFGNTPRARRNTPVRNSA